MRGGFPVLAQVQEVTSPLPLVLLVGIVGLVTLALAFIGLLLLSHHRVMAATQSEADALRAQAEVQQRLLDAAQAGRLVLWSEDQDRGQLEFGGAAQDVLGAIPADLDELLERVVPEDRGGAEALLRGDSPGEVPVQNLRMVGPAGEVILTQWQVRTVNGRREGVLRDVTRESRLMAQLIQSQKMEAVGALVAGVSHEFGNLIMTVESCVGPFLRDDSLSDRQRQAAGFIHDAAERGSGLVARMMGIVRPAHGALAPVRVDQCLIQLEETLGPLFKNQCRVRVNTDPTNIFWPMDRAEILQALLNLCINAKDAMPVGGTVDLRARVDGEELVLEVEDSGKGVPEHLKGRIFDPFFTTKDPGKGTGLGLAVTQAIVEGQGGRIEVHDGAGGGALFRISLPRPAQA